MKLIQIKNLSFSYNEEKILDNIDLQINQKDFLGIIGPNGGGKTTLIKIILGLLKPDAGTVDSEKNLSFGYVPQNYSVKNNFPITVFQTVLMGALDRKIKMFHKFTKKDKAKAHAILREQGLDHFSNQLITNLSGGQRQRVYIARALMTSPDILILDEPTANVDANSSNNIYNQLKKLNDSITIIIISHDIGVLSTHVKQIACLNKTLFYHGSDESKCIDSLEEVYGCPIDLIGHSEHPHKVLKSHNHGVDRK